MSDLTMTATEEKDIDSQIEKMVEWAKTRNVEAEQLALDSARLLAASTDRLDRLTKQPFFKRCWSRFNGDAASLEKANVNDVIQMQKMAFRYVNMLQEQQLLMANSLLTLKNNLNSLAIKEEETRKLIALLADKTRERFEKLENRVDQLEISTNLQGWLLGLDQRDYDEKYPTEYMRLLRVINDFYSLKKKGWNYNDLMFMRKAIQTVGLNPKEKISLNKLIDRLTEEIQNKDVGIDAYTKAISAFKPDGMDNYSQFAIDNVSSPVYATLHGLKTHYEDKADAVEALQDSLSISAPEALKVLLKNGIKAMNINLDYESTLAEIALEILGCMSLEEELLSEAPSSSLKELPDSLSNNAPANNNDQNNSEEGALDAIPTEPVDEIAKEETSKQDILDIYKLSFGSWESNLITIDDVSSIDSLAFFDHRLFASSNNILLMSKDGKKWEKSGEINGAYLFGGKLFTLPNTLVFIPAFGNYCFGMNKNYEWFELKLPTSTKEDGSALNYISCCHNQEANLYLASLEKSYNVIQKKFWKDSVEKITYKSAYIITTIIGKSDSNNKTSAQDISVKDYNIEAIAVAGDSFFLLFNKLGFSEPSIIYQSKDGLNWGKANWLPNEKIYSIYNGGDSLVFALSSGVFAYHVNDQRITRIDLPDGRTTFSDLVSFKEFGVYIINDDYEEKISITNDFKSWKQQACPVSKRKAIAMDRDLLAICAEGNDIYTSIIRIM